MTRIMAASCVEFAISENKLTSATTTECSSYSRATVGISDDSNPCETYIVESNKFTIANSDQNCSPKYRNSDIENDDEKRSGSPSLKLSNYFEEVDGAAVLSNQGSMGCDCLENNEGSYISNDEANRKNEEIEVSPRFRRKSVIKYRDIKTFNDKANIYKLDCNNQNCPSFQYKTDDNAHVNKMEDVQNAKDSLILNKPRSNSAVLSSKVVYKIINPIKYMESKDLGFKINRSEKNTSDKSKAASCCCNQRTDTSVAIKASDTLVKEYFHDDQKSEREVPLKIANSPKGSLGYSPSRSEQTSPSKRTRSPMNQDYHAIEVKSSNGTSSPPRDGYSAKQDNRKKCENCGEPHFSYDRYSYLRKYSGFLDSDLGVYDENNVPKDLSGRGMDNKLETRVPPLLYRSRSLPRLSVHDSGVACSGNEQTPGAGPTHHSRQFVADLKQLLTLKQHYYPEGGWGWIVIFVGVLVQVLSHGLQGSAGVLLQQVASKFGPSVHLQSGWLGAMSTGIALLVSPVTIAFCRRKSTRLTAVLGGLVTALGCLFTSFASQFHQLFFSYGAVVGIGVGITRDCSTLMVAQYFKRRRELVEIFIVSGSGLGIAIMSVFIKGAISKIGWRLGLQAVTAVVFLTFFLGTFYRSASLYHPQRRAILHLKNQKRKIKDKNKADDKPPFFDFSTLKSKTVRILLISTGISAFGINTPIFYLAHQAEEEGLGDMVVLLQAYLGLAWTLGCVTFGLLVVHRSVECRIARQYLTQAAVFVCGLCILALTAIQGNYHGYVMFAWIYGIFCGGYHYSLKMYTYERVRARNFAKTWGFVQCSQAIPIAIGVPISGYINVGCGGKAGYYFSSTCVLVGSFTLFFIDLHRRNLSRHKHTRANGTKHLCISDSCPQRRRLSFSQEPENDGPHVAAAGATAAALVLGAEVSPTPGDMIDVLGPDKPELTCISEEGIADMDLPDNLLEDLDYIGDCITSCNKVENYLMLSEFENNLIAEMPIIMDRRGRRWSVARSKGGQTTCVQPENVQSKNEEDDSKSKWCNANLPPSTNSRVITVIDEASA